MVSAETYPELPRSRSSVSKSACLLVDRISSDLVETSALAVVDGIRSTSGSNNGGEISVASGCLSTDVCIVSRGVIGRDCCVAKTIACGVEMH